MAGSLARARAEHAAALARAQEAAEAQARARSQAAILARRGVRDAARLRDAEQRESETTNRIESLATERDADRARIAALTATLAATIPAMEVLRAAPMGAILDLPGALNDRAAGAAAVGGVARTVAAELAELRARRAEADRLAASLATERTRLAGEHDRQLAEANRVEGAVRAANADERRAQDASEAASRDAAASAAQAASLSDAIATLAAQQRRTEDAARHQAAPAAPDEGPGLGPGAVVPVAGRVVQRFGETTDAGISAGISFAPPPAAIVSAPCRGTVAFAAPFRSYGRMVILDCGHSWRFVLAGLASVDAQPGAHVRAGEPVGRMPDFTPGGAAGRPTLYVQLRHGSAAVDPRRAIR